MARKYTEELLWILDNVTVNGSLLKDDDKYAFNRNFVKSLGLKSDVVGWCTLQEKTMTDDTINRIIAAADNVDCSVRGHYTFRLSPEYEHEWYLLQEPRYHSYDDISLDFTGNAIKAAHIFAYKHTEPILENGLVTLLSEKTVNALREGGYGEEFQAIWVPDKGKYRARQYFEIAPRKYVTTIYSDFVSGDREKQLKIYAEYYGENASLVSSLLDEVQMLSLPLGVDADDIGQERIIGITSYTGNGHKTNCVIVRASVRKYLIENNIVPEKYFEGVIVFDANDESKKAWIKKAAQSSIFTEDIISRRNQSYQAFLKKEKPELIVSEKQAIALLKRKKKDDAASFGKALSEKNASLLPDARLCPYYKVSDGGYVNDEYHYLPSSRLAELQQQFENELAYEGLISISFDGATVFGANAEGEYLILHKNGSVMLYTMGEYQATIEWKSLEAFFYEELQN